MVQAATVEVFGIRPVMLKEIEFKKALFLPENDSQRVEVIFSPNGEKETSFCIYSHPGGEEQTPKSWTVHAIGKIRLA
jgi:hypothetical protein